MASARTPYALQGRSDVRGVRNRGYRSSRRKHRSCASNGGAVGLFFWCFTWNPRWSNKHSDKCDAAGSSILRCCELVSYPTRRLATMGEGAVCLALILVLACSRVAKHEEANMGNPLFEPEGSQMRDFSILLFHLSYRLSVFWPSRCVYMCTIAGNKNRYRLLWLKGWLHLDSPFGVRLSISGLFNLITIRYAGALM